MKVCIKCNAKKTIDDFCKNRNTCKDCKRANNKKWRVNNKDYINGYFKEYCKGRKQKQKRNERMQSRRKFDPSFKLRDYTSKHIHNMLKSTGSSKHGHSILEFLPYSMQELKTHLEKQFEPWMSWDNWGVYRSNKWDDNDPLTWTWQLDHIIPQSDLPYTSMEEKNFTKCWALKNLRPYSSKQNLLDGTSQARHKN